MAVIGDSEPLEGREARVKAQLKEALRSPERAAFMSTRTYTPAGGRALSDRMTSHLEVLMWVRSPYLTYRQQRVIELTLGEPDLTLDEAARRLGISRALAAQEKRAAIEAIIRIVWNDPGYQTPRTPTCNCHSCGRCLRAAYLRDAGRP